jgi:hypothetical protein
MWRTLRPNKEDRIAKLEWAPNGGLGRVVMGKVSNTFLVGGNIQFLTILYIEYAANGGSGSTGSHDLRED